MENWKESRAEQEMKGAESAMMKKAAEANQKVEDAKWDKIKESLYVGSKKEDDNIDWVIDEMRKKYYVPRAK